ncbi:MAG: amino acid permease [Planctomycetes bacterium]|nr:amino acid permease [Planctomycetota bacterium]
MTTHQDDGNVDDQGVMSRFHYKQELRRTIRLFGSFAVAFSFISITTGIFANYELVLDRSGPAGIWTWPVVIVGQLLVALVFAELAAKMPLTGYSYQWVTRLGGSGWGWFTGWVSICFLIIVIPSVNHGIASVVGHIWDIPNASIGLKWIVCGVIALQALIHVFGVRFAERINSAAVFSEILGMVGLVLIFVFLAVKNQPSLGILLERGPAPEGQAYLPVWIMACLMGAYTIVGFESAANLSEETIDAARTVPKAVISSVVVSGGVGMLFLIVTILSIRDLDAVIESSYPLPMIIETNLGKPVAMAFFLLVVISIFACGLIIMASGSRMIYAMARDNVFFGNTLFRRVSASTSAPVPAILLVAILGALAEWYSESLEQLLAAAAVLPALVYLMTVVTYALRRKSLTPRSGQFSLGRWGGMVAGLAIAWLVSIIAILTIPREFHNATWVSAAVCVVGVVLYWGWIKGRIARGIAGVHAADVNVVDEKADPVE